MNNNSLYDILVIVAAFVIAAIVQHNVDKEASNYHNWYLKGVEYCEPHGGLEYLDGGEFTCHNGVVINPDDSKEN